MQWIILHDPDAVFRFGSLQGETGKKLIKEYAIPEKMDSVILIEKNKVYYKSGAALRIAKKCKGLWKLGFIFIIVPPFIRNAVYDIVARNRYKWYGKKMECWLPSPALSSRFLP